VRHGLARLSLPRPYRHEMHERRRRRADQTDPIARLRHHPRALHVITLAQPLGKAGAALRHRLEPHSAVQRSEVVRQCVGDARGELCPRELRTARDVTRRGAQQLIIAVRWPKKLSSASSCAATSNPLCVPCATSGIESGLSGLSAPRTGSPRTGALWSRCK